MQRLVVGNSRKAEAKHGNGIVVQSLLSEKHSQVVERAGMVRLRGNSLLKPLPSLVGIAASNLEKSQLIGCFGRFSNLFLWP